MPARAARLRLLLPGLRPGTPAAGGPDLPPPLARLLARADWHASGVSTRAALLADFGYAPDTAVAPLLALHDLDLEPAPAAGWLRADPVHFRADPKLVLMFAPSVEEIAEDEADGFLDALRAAIPEYEWRRGTNPARWYVKGAELDATPSLGPAWLHGRSVTPFFPQDVAHRRWRRLMSEAQMAMHAAPPNEQRSARGAAPLNAIWLWGGGAPHREAGGGMPAAAVGADLLLAGLARARGVARWPVLAADGLGAALAAGSVVAVCGAPFGGTGEATPAVADAAAQWAALAWASLRAGDLEAVELVGEGIRGELRPAARWRLWRRRPDSRFDDPHAVENAP